MKLKIKKILVAILLILVLINTASTLIESNRVFAEPTTTTATTTTGTDSSRPTTTTTTTTSTTDSTRPTTTTTTGTSGGTSDTTTTGTVAGGTSDTTTTTTTTTETNSEGSEGSGSNGGTQAQQKEAKLFEEREVAWGAGDLLDGVVGILTTPLKLLILALGTVLRVLIGAITAIGGDAVWSVEDIIFNHCKLTDINFFTMEGTTTAISTIRANVATWYYAIRNLAIVILLFILIYVGIRMAIATVGEQEAKYKKMLKDWIVSLALIFVLHYIMIFTININNILVDVLDDARVYMNNRDLSSDAGQVVENTADLFGTDVNKNGFDSALNVFAEGAFSISFSAGFGSALIYIILIGVTIMFLIMYIKRMLTIGFLIVISPLITITYSIDKMGDGKSQALNAWLKEFVFNILIQPFHCVIYMVFADIAMDLVTNDRTLASAVLAIIMMLFIFTAEKIIKKIFNFQASSLGEAIGSAAAMATGISLIQKFGKAKSNSKVDPDKAPEMQNKGKLKKVPNQGNSGGNSQSKAQTPQRQQTPNNTQSSSSSSSNNSYSSNRSSGKTAQDKRKEKIASTAGNVAKQVLNPFSDFNKKAAGMIMLGGLGLSTGSVKTGMAGLYAGSAAVDGINGMINKHKGKQIVKNNQESFAGSYNNFQEKTNMTDKQMQVKTAQYLEMSNTEALATLNDDEYEYYTDVQNMKSTFDAVGDSDAKQAVLETVEMVQTGDIEPTYYGEEVWEEPAPEPVTTPEPVATPEPQKQQTASKQTKKSSNSKKSTSGNSKKKSKGKNSK